MIISISPAQLQMMLYGSGQHAGDLAAPGLAQDLKDVQQMPLPIGSGQPGNGATDLGHQAKTSQDYADWARAAQRYTDKAQHGGVQHGGAGPKPDGSG